MTYGVKQIGGIVSLLRGGPVWKYAFFDYSGWPYWARKAWDYCIQCHYGHLLDFAVALAFYQFVWPLTFPHAKTLDFSVGGWISIVVAFNLAVEWTLFPFWHWMTYSTASLASKLRGYKYNQLNQYEGPDRWDTLRREMTFTTLGWLQGAAYQCAIMWLYATGRAAYHEDMWGTAFAQVHPGTAHTPALPGLAAVHPLLAALTTPKALHVAGSLAGVALITYWREFHFYWCHRMIHPYGWWAKRNLPPAQGGTKGTLWPYLDLGQALYTYAHSLHHKSHNPGPWSGLSMHPLEHFFYYQCILLPLLWRAHPLAFLYALYHANVAPIGGHDGYAAPGGDGAFHWLHHHKYECNYGVPLIDFDSLFGTYVDYQTWLDSGKGSVAQALAYSEKQKKEKSSGQTKLE